MRHIILTQGLTTTVDDQDYHLYGAYLWCVNSKGYAVRSVPLDNGKQRTVYLHRMIMLAVAGEEVHHIDGDPLNNTRENLVKVTRSQHKYFHSAEIRRTWRHKPPKAGTYKGVNYDAKRNLWRVRIKADTRGQKHVGRYKTIQEAAVAYNNAAMALWGNDCYLNQL